MFLIIIAILVLTIAVASFVSMRRTSRKNLIYAHLHRLKDFSPIQTVISIDIRSAISLDDKRKKICLLDFKQPIVLSRIFSYKDILSSEIFENGTTITKTVRSSQIGGALIGGLALGGIGAIIGGLSGKTETDNKIKNLDLRIIVNDIKNPLHDIRFMGYEKKGSFFYEAAVKSARHWHGILEVLIKQADADDKQTKELAEVNHQILSIADEIKKLAELRDSGILSEEEFQKQKSYMLTSSK